MEWKKGKLKVWFANGYQIIEMAEDNGKDGLYRLETPECDGTFTSYGKLEHAKRAAENRNELELVKADNARLRAELDQRKGVWPAGPVDEDDGRGIPLNGTHASNSEFPY